MDRSVLRSTSTHVLVDPDRLIAGGTVVLDDAAEHHLRRVLRIRDGETIGLTDGAGRWCLAVVRVTGSDMHVETTSEIVTERPSSRSVTIAAAIPKGDRLDWMVQKVTELGADRLVLLHADRSVVRWTSDRVGHHLQRLQRVADEALRQSRRVVRLQIDPPVTASEVLGGFVVAEPGGRALRPDDTAVAIGPEGGWSPPELAAARDRIDLGPNILRTETAAIAVCTLCVTGDR